MDTSVGPDDEKAAPNLSGREQRPHPSRLLLRSAPARVTAVTQLQLLVYKLHRFLPAPRNRGEVVGPASGQRPKRRYREQLVQGLEGGKVVALRRFEGQVAPLGRTVDDEPEPRPRPQNPADLREVQRLVVHRAQHAEAPS